MKDKEKRISFPVTRKQHFQIRNYAYIHDLSIKGVFFRMFNLALNHPELLDLRAAKDTDGKDE